MWRDGKKDSGKERSWFVFRRKKEAHKEGGWLKRDGGRKRGKGKNERLEKGRL